MYLEPKHTFEETKMVRNTHQEDSNPGSDPGSNPGSDLGLFVVYLENKRVLPHREFHTEKHEKIHKTCRNDHTCVHLEILCGGLQNKETCFQLAGILEDNGQC